MGTVARLKKDGDFLISGEVSERVPMVTSGLIAHYPFDDTFDVLYDGIVYKDSTKEWSTNDFVDGLMYDVKSGTYSTLILEADIFLEETPTERFTVLQSVHQSGSMYLSVDSTLKVSVYNHLKVTDGYHASNATLELRKWYKVTHINTPTETVIMIDGVVDRVIANNNEASMTTSQIFIGAENSSRHFKGKIRNVKVDSIDPRQKLTVTNSTITPEGALVEVSRSNLIKTVSGADPLFRTSSGWTMINDANYQSSIVFDPESIYGGTVLKVVDNDGDTVNGEWGGVYCNRVTGLVAGKKYTMKIRFKVESWTTGTVAIWSHQQDTTGVNATTPNDYGLPSGKFNKGWQEHTATITMNTGYDSKTFTIGMDKANLGCTIYVDAIQFEEGTFATGFTDSSRGDGRIDVPFNLKPPYSINFFHKSDYPLADVIDQPTSPMLLQMGTYYANASLSLWNYIKVLRTYIKGDASTGWTASTSLLTYSDATWNGVEHMYTIVAVDNRTFKVYMDGNYLGISTSSEDVTNITYLSMGNTSTPNAKYRDLSIYNKVLTDNEINTLYNNKMPIDKFGNLDSKVIEQPKIPNESMYFSLSSSAEEDNRRLTPILDTADYQEGDAWCGRGTVNQVNNPCGYINPRAYTAGWDASLHADALQVDYWSAGYNSGVPSPEIGYHAKWVYEGMNGNPCVKFIDRNDLYSLGHRWLGVSQSLGTPASLGWATGDRVTISWYQKSDTLGKGANVGLYHTLISTGGYSFSGAQKTIYVTKKDSWERVSYTFTIDSDWKLDANCLIYIYGNYGNYGTFWVDNMQIEKTPFPTPFVNGTRGKTAIEIDKSLLNVNAGAIIGWWNFNESARSYRGVNNDNDYAMLFSTYEGSELNKLNIRSYYSSATGYWATSVSGASASAPTIGFTVTDGWHLIALCWDKTNSKLKLLVDGDLISEQSTADLPAVFNTHLRIGDWAGGTNVWGSMNMFVKDLIILNRYPSNKEVENLFDKKMSLDKSKLIIQNTINEGVVL